MPLYVFPARAGMIPQYDPLVLNAGGIPRESGDDPFVLYGRYDPRTYSPRERG